METVEQLDADVGALRARLATLQAQRANLTSILLSQPRLAARLESAQPAKRLINAQTRRNRENVYRACTGVTAFKVHDPDPHAASDGNILGIRIDVSVRARFVATYHVLFSFPQPHRYYGTAASRTLRIHKHTIPPCIPIQQLASKFLPLRNKDGGADADADADAGADATGSEQDLMRFGRMLRKELVSWHTRVQAVKSLQEEAGLMSTASGGEGADDMDSVPMAKVLNAFASNDGESDEEDDDDGGPDRIVDVEADAPVRQVTVTWSSGRTAIVSVAKDGKVERATCRSRDGSREVVLARRAIGPLGGLVRRLREVHDR